MNNTTVKTSHFNIYIYTILLQEQTTTKSYWTFLRFYAPSRLPNRKELDELTQKDLQCISGVETDYRMLKGSSWMFVSNDFWDQFIKTSSTCFLSVCLNAEAVLFRWCFVYCLNVTSCAGMHMCTSGLRLKGTEVSVHSQASYDEHWIARYLMNLCILKWQEWDLNTPNGSLFINVNVYTCR